MLICSVCLLREREWILITSSEQYLENKKLTATTTMAKVQMQQAIRAEPSKAAPKTTIEITKYLKKQQQNTLRRKSHLQNINLFRISWRNAEGQPIIARQWCANYLHTHL